MISISTDLAEAAIAEFLLFDALFHCKLEKRPHCIDTQLFTHDEYHCNVTKQEPQHPKNLANNVHSRAQTQTTDGTPPNQIKKRIGVVSHGIGSVLILQRSLHSFAQRGRSFTGLIRWIQGVGRQHHWRLVSQVQGLHHRAIELVNLEHHSTIVWRHHHLVGLEPSGLHVPLVLSVVRANVTWITQKLSSVDSDRCEDQTSVGQELISTMLVCNRCNRTRVVLRVGFHSVHCLFIVSIGCERVGDSWQGRLDQELINRVVEARAGEDGVRFGSPGTFQLSHAWVSQNTI